MYIYLYIFYPCVAKHVYTYIYMCVCTPNENQKYQLYKRSRHDAMVLWFCYSKTNQMKPLNLVNLSKKDLFLEMNLKKSHKKGQPRWARPCRRQSPHCLGLSQQRPVGLMVLLQQTALCGGLKQFMLTGQLCSCLRMQHFWRRLWSWLSQRRQRGHMTTPSALKMLLRLRRLATRT